MKTMCRLTMKYKNKTVAESILGAVDVDDFDFVTSHIDEEKLVAEIKSDSLNSLIHTLDDYLACLNIAEKVVNNN